MKRFETSIKTLMRAKTEYVIKHGSEPIFLSNWDSDYSSVIIPEYDYNITKREAQKYYYLTDEINNKQYFSAFYNHYFKIELDTDCFTIAPNGTSCLMLSLFGLKEMDLKNVLVTTPVYFSTLNLLDELDYNVERLDLNYNNDFTIDLLELDNIIRTKNIQILIITNPLFGVGVELSECDIKAISKICNKHNVWFIMDYIYGGLPWYIDNAVNYIFNNEIYNAIRISHKHIFIESISKRIFLNGVKTALLFTTNNFLRRILRLSVFTIGSMSATQVKIVNELYSIYNTDYIIESISENALRARRNYDKICAIFKNTDIMISNSAYGYFSLITIPKQEKKHNDIEYAKNILYKTGVLTTPHSRYLFEYPNYYSFRVNLLLDEYELINGVFRIKTLI